MSKKKRKKPNVRRPAMRSAGVPPAADEEKPPQKHEGGETPPSGAAGTAALRAVDRELALGRAAYELFLAEGGGDLEALMENGQCTARAYTSQIRAAEEGGQGWGPTVTPYEDRMTRSLQLRLIRERRKWIEECRQRIEAAMEESDVAVPAARNAGVSPAADQEKPSPGGESGRGDTGADSEASAGETPTSLRADRMSTSRIAAIGERMAEEARAETAMMEEAIAQAHAEIAQQRERRQNLPDSAFPKLQAVSQSTANGE